MKPDLPEMIHEASDLLSHQAIMENFVHHNPWEALQNMEFYDALQHVEDRQAHMSPGERLSSITPLDPRVRANKAMAELGAPFLDRGLAKWEAPNREKGFLYFFASLEGLGLAPWRGYARNAAIAIMDRMDRERDLDVEMLAAEILEQNLMFFEDDPTLWTETTRSIMLDLPGWAGMFKRMEEHPSEGPASCRDGTCQIIPVRLCEFVAVQSIFARASIEASAIGEGFDPNRESLSSFISTIPNKRRVPRSLFGMGKEMQSLQNPSGLASSNQNFDMHRQLEDAYSKVTLRAMNVLQNPQAGGSVDGRPRANIQVFTCFDEREESFRRYIEAQAQSPHDIETYGVAGFFNVAIRISYANNRPEEILAPEGNCPPLNHLVDMKQLTPGHDERKKLLAELSLAYERASFSPVGSLAIAAALLPFQISSIVTKSFAPQTTVALEDKFLHTVVPESRTDFAPPFTAEEATGKLAQLFKNTGSKTHFARIIVMAGHGARSVNNPFLAAYNCGACCGREGGPNARVFARYANDPTVRQMLRDDHDIHIPDDTWFIGSYHDTTSDLVEVYDLDRLPPTHNADWARAKAVIDEARMKNALERCSKFFLADVKTPAEALKHVETRSRDMAEARPELGHSTNAAIILGRRELTKGRFFDRRTFLPTYDPWNDDDEGSNLATVLAPALVVGSGISLEYFFSTTDAGAGTKTPVNVVGNFAIQQGTAGDLLIGLATQMSELHSPQRALYLIDSPVDRVERVLARNPNLKQIVRNNWVNFYVRDPSTQEIYHQYNGEYTLVTPDFYQGIEQYADTYVPFTRHGDYCTKVKFEEDVATAIAYGIMIASATVPLFYNAAFDLSALNGHQALITAGATTLGVSALAFSRRYLHGEFMYGRMSIVSAFMVTGFNLVAAAPDIEGALLGWTLIGYSSTFLIGGFNDRPTARDNAAFAFGVYQISDAALLMAAAFSTGAAADDPGSQGIVALGLIIAASIKASQFPLSGLFLRSMEGATPNSALGYAAVSAHVGPVLLASTMPVWGQFEWAHLLIGGTGVLTIIQSGILANVRADRKGGLASAAAATLGAIFIVLAFGYDDAALLLCLGHGSFRMNQVLRSPSAISDTHKWEAALGYEQVASQKTFEVVWRLGWFFNRINNDWFRLPDIFANVDLKQPLVFYNSKATQLIVTGAILSLTAAFHLPAVEETTMELMKDNSAAAALLILLNLIGSTSLIRFVLGNVLDFGRFRPTLPKD